MAKLTQAAKEKPVPEERQQLENRFKRAIFSLGASLELPPTPEPPANLFGHEESGEMRLEDRRAIWELQQDVAILKQRYNLIVKVVWRTSAALLGLAAPLLGSDLLSKLIRLLAG
jgi:hypothetical protein